MSVTNGPGGRGNCRDCGERHVDVDLHRRCADCRAALSQIGRSFDAVQMDIAYRAGQRRRAAREALREFAAALEAA